MKKFLSIFLALLMLISCTLTACQDPDSDKEPENPSESDDEEYDPYPYDDLSVFMDLPEFKNLSVTESEIDDYINSDIAMMLNSQNLYQKVSEGVAQKWNKAIIDYVGVVDGEVFDGGSAKDYGLILGSGSFVPGFEDGVIGMAIGEVKPITFNFPENYYEHLAGKEVTFTVTLKELYVFPEIDDEFCNTHTYYKTFKEFRSALKAEYIENYAFDTLLNRCTLKSKPEEYTEYYQSFISYFTGYADYYNMTLEAFLGVYGNYFTSYGLYKGITLDGFYTVAEDYAESNTVNDLLMYSVIRKLGLKTEGEGYEKAKAQLMSAYENKTYEELIEENGKITVITSIMHIQTKTALAEYVIVTK